MNDIFLRKINEIRTAIDEELYNCALALALTLPDICGKVEYPKERSPGKRYKEWFSEYAEPFFKVVIPRVPDGEIVEITWISYEECWALRCAVLHAGNYDTQNIDLSNIQFHAHKRNGKNYSYMIRDSYFANWDVIDLCKKLCDAAEQYYYTVEDKTLFVLDEVKIEF